MKKLPGILLCGLSALLLTACDSGRNEPSPAGKKDSIPSDVVQLSQEQVRNAGIAVGRPVEKDMHSTLRVAGVVDVPPQNVVSISIPMGGYIKKLDLIPGQRVGRGTVLVTLEDQQYIQLQQDYLTSRSKLQYLEADYARQRDLNATKAVSDKTFQLAQSEFNSQKVLAKALAEKLRLIGLSPEILTEGNFSRTIRVSSPIDGYVTKVNVNTGKYVTPTDVLLELIDPRDLHLSLTVFENDAARLTPGAKVVCFTNARPDVKYTATIHLITPDIGQDRSTEVHCDLDQRSRELIPGTYMNAEVQLNNARVKALPQDAVVKWENKWYVFVEEEAGQFRLLPVETGASTDGYIEIRTALPANNIVTKNAYTLLMKMKNSGEEG